MKKLFFGLAMSMASFNVYAAETCYQVSSEQDLWSRTPEMLCINQINSNANQYQISLKTGLRPVTIVSFNYNLVQRARCLDCNADKYALANPSNSSFNILSVEFNGDVDPRTGNESGTVNVGSNTFYYRTFPKRR